MNNAAPYSTRAQQERLYEERFPNALADIIWHLERDEAYRQHLHDLGLERLRKGYEVFGDEMYRWSTACRQRNIDEELADALVYLTSEVSDGWRK